MAQVIKEAAGTFMGRTLIQQSGKIGGAKHVFVREDGIRDNLEYFPFGGRVANPFKGAAKLFAGDLLHMKYDENTESPVLYILKTYKVVSASGKTVNIERSGYRHIPFVGDVLTIAPTEIGGQGEALTVSAVAKNTVDGTDVWALTLSKTPTTAPAKDDVLVEANADGTMLVTNINAVADCDYDFLFNPAADGSSMDDFESARYFMTPAQGGTMYISKMSPLPACVKALNIANVDGWFGVHAKIKPAILQVKG
jgi:hypothetical protein